MYVPESSTATSISDASTFAYSAIHFTKRMTFSMLLRRRDRRDDDVRFRRGDPAADVGQALTQPRPTIFPDIRRIAHMTCAFPGERGSALA